MLLQSIVCDCTLPSGKHNELTKNSPNKNEKQRNGRRRPPLNFGEVYIGGVVEFGWGGKWIQLTKNKNEVSQQSEFVTVKINTGNTKISWIQNNFPCSKVNLCEIFFGAIILNIALPFDAFNRVRFEVFFAGVAICYTNQISISSA